MENHMTRDNAHHEEPRTQHRMDCNHSHLMGPHNELNTSGIDVSLLQQATKCLASIPCASADGLNKNNISTLYLANDLKSDNENTLTHYNIQCYNSVTKLNPSQQYSSTLEDTTLDSGYPIVPNTSCVKEPSSFLYNNCTKQPDSEFFQGVSNKLNCTSVRTSDDEVDGDIPYTVAPPSSPIMMSHELSKQCKTFPDRFQIIYPPVTIFNDGLNGVIRAPARNCRSLNTYSSNRTELNKKLSIAEYNSSLLYLNSHLKHTEEYTRLPFLKGDDGAVLFLPKGAVLPNIHCRSIVTESKDNGKMQRQNSTNSTYSSLHHALPPFKYSKLQQQTQPSLFARFFNCCSYSIDENVEDDTHSISSSHSHGMFVLQDFPHNT